MIRFILLFLPILLLTSCCPSNKDLIKALRASGEVEIVTKYDTVFSKFVSRDTIFNMDSVVYDRPFIIEREKLRVEIHRIKGDTLRVLATCKPDTIITIKEVLKLQDVKEFPVKWWEWIVYTLAGFSVAVLIAAIIRVFRKK